MSNKITGDAEKFIGGAFSIINNAKQEIDNIVKSKINNYLCEMDFVTREEYEVLKEMVAALQNENKELLRQVEELKNAS